MRLRNYPTKRKLLKDIETSEQRTDISALS